jgi:hypothetical protein
MPKDKRIYEPGELQKTRDRLGELSREEAKEMQSKLGGEIGYEKTATKVEKGYQKLKDQLPDGGLVDGKATSSAFLQAKGKRKKAVPKLPVVPPGMKFWERLRTNLHLTKMEYSFKTLGQAIFGAFSSKNWQNDMVSRDFVINADHQFAKGIDILVMAVRGLSTRSNKKILQGLRKFPLYLNIIKALREWPIESIHEALLEIQKVPSNINFTDFYPLIQLCMKTVYILSPLSVTGHILPAISKTFELGKIYTTKQPALERLRKHYAIAREEAPIILEKLYTKFYPPLLKFLSPEFVTEEAFYTAYHDRILKMLHLTPETLLYPEKSTGVIPDSSSESKEKAKGEPVELEDYFPEFSLHPLAQKAVEILEVLFPGARWAELEKQPDFLAYYLPFLEFPRGTELLSPADPLQPVLSLVAILQNMLHGFQNCRWGILDEYSTQGHLQQEFEKIVSQLHFFVEEVAGKHYLPLIQELCRQVERDGSIGPEARKKMGKILYIKRNFFLPNLMMPVVDNLKHFPINHPPLSLIVKRALDLLSKVAVEVEQSLFQAQARPHQNIRSQSLHNPKARWRFEIPSPVSNRLSVVFQKVNRVTKEEIGGVEGRTNRKLLFYTISILTYLDDLINQQGSPLYTRGDTPLYRQVSLNDPRPVYTAPSRDTLRLLKKHNEQTLSSGKILVMDENPRDYYDTFLFDDEIERRMEDFKEEKQPFVLGALQIQFHQGLNRAATKARVEEILSEVHPGSDIRTWRDESTLMWISINQDEREGMILKQVLIKGSQESPQPIPLFGFVVPYDGKFNKQKYLDLPYKGASQAEGYPPQVLGMYNPDSKVFRYLEELPAVKPDDSEAKSLEEL